jgi:hypothetical protein
VKSLFLYTGTQAAESVMFPMMMWLGKVTTRILPDFRPLNLFLASLLAHTLLVLESPKALCPN